MKDEVLKAMRDHDYARRLKDKERRHGEDRQPTDTGIWDEVLSDLDVNTVPKLHIRDGYAWMQFEDEGMAYNTYCRVWTLPSGID